MDDTKTHKQPQHQEPHPQKNAGIAFALIKTNTANSLPMHLKTYKKEPLLRSSYITSIKLEYNMPY
ncbi:MAG: hypothetical protein HFH39_11735 [Lachnospiraceae bacterium]|nr:hypothetical protein [Bacilli bacterium]MCI9005878.1 hypothetical protein [Lachnospiraceae bacterium]